MKMIDAFILAAVVTGVCGLNMSGQTARFQWVQHSGGTGDGMNYAASVAVDRATNTYVTGYFQTTAVFGTNALVSEGAEDIFVAKYDRDGGLLWVRRAGGAYSDKSYGIAVDPAGNCYVTGFFKDAAHFGNITLTSSGTGPTNVPSDVFVAKYSATGELQWAHSAGGSSDDTGYSIAADAAGACYLTGYFQGAAQFGATTLTSVGSSDVFVAKYTTTGQLEWAQQFGSPSQDNGRGITVDPAGNLFVTGYFADTMIVGNTNLTNAGYTDTPDVFLVKLNSQGAVQWAQGAGGPLWDFGFGVAADNAGFCYVTGIFSGEATFNGVAVTGNGSYDCFLAKYNPNGGVEWVKTAGGADTDVSYGVAVDGKGNSYITGYFTTNSVFGNLTLTSAGFGDVFVAKYDNAGKLIAAQRAGGTANDYGNGIAGDNDGNCFVAGQFFGPATFGDDLTVSSADRIDAFVARWSAPDMQTPLDLTLSLCPAVRINGTVGNRTYVEYASILGGSTNWIGVTNFLLPSSPYLFIDLAATNANRRYYRAFQTP